MERTSVVDSESDSEEIFFGPITKREIMSKLKYYNLDNKELVAPLEKYEDDDVLNESLVNYYDQDIFLKSCENKDTTRISSQLNLSSVTESIKSLSESQLLEKYKSSTSFLSQEIQTEDNSSVHEIQSLQNLNLDENKKTMELNNLASVNSCKTPLNTSDNSDFNCTLEEIEMLMKFGENYMNENKIQSPVNDKENCLQVIDKSSIKKKEKIHIPNINKQKSSVYNSPSPFKMPSARVISSQKSPAYKNIVSPIAMYIKSSPRVPLVQNVAKETIQKGVFREINNKRNQDIENTQTTGSELPVRSYKPAIKTMIVSKEEEPSMPSNVRKLIKGPLTPQIIKHVTRLNTNNTPDQDFTILSDNNSFQNVQAEISIYVSKNAARTNRLQF